MQFRSMSGRNDAASFSRWLEQQEANDNPQQKEEEVSFLGRMGSIQESFTSQLQDLSGSLPDGPLSAEFRTRVTHSIYMLATSVFFAILAVILGVPTILIRPSKFVICVTLSTGFAAGSVIVMQKPSVFFASVLAGGYQTAIPIAALFITTISTLYVTVFMPRYLYILIAGCVQMAALLFYMASFIPGGTNGLIVLLRTMYMVVSTAAAPFIYVAKKTTLALCRLIVNRVTSSQ